MTELGPGFWVAAPLIAAGAASIRSSVGFGDALAAMPLFTLLLGLEAASALVALLTATVCASMLAFDRSVTLHRDLRRLLPATVLGIPLGFFLRVTLPEDWARVGLALAIFWACFSRYRDTPDRPPIDGKVAPAFGFASGALAGAYNTPGPPLAAYSTLARWKPAETRGTLQPLALLCAAFVTAGHIVNGSMTTRILTVYGCLVVPVLLGVWTGSRLARRIDERTFTRLVVALLAVIASTLLGEAVWSLTHGRGVGSEDPIGESAPHLEERMSVPTHADVVYGPHPAQRFDLYLADVDGPAPLAVYIHGGGFRAGSKEKINPRTLNTLLEAGLHVASVEYRLLQAAKLPAAHLDGLRALQTLRARSGEWGIDKTRVAAFGGSAGAQICMWLAFHEDMAKPDSNDPVERESSRLSYVATSGGQTTMDFNWWMANIPGYTEPHRPASEYFGDLDEARLEAVVGEISALGLARADAPPIHMRYGMAPGDAVPDDDAEAEVWKVHHVAFGVALKQKMDALGVEAHLVYPGAQAEYETTAEFLVAKLGR